jgi:MFS family permease
LTAPSAAVRLAQAFGAGLPSNFWKLWTSAASANLADGVTLVAIPLIAVRLTDSPAEVAGVAVAFQVPMLLLGLIAGGLADRIDRRWTMLAVQLLRVAVIGTLTLLALADALSMPVLYAVAFVLGAGETFFDTNAQAILPAVVGRERLVTANGRLFAAETIMNTFVGPPLGGLLVAIAVPVALSGAALGFAVAALGLLLIAGSFRADKDGVRRALAVEIGEGIGYLLRHRLLLTLSSMVALGRLGSAGIFALLALHAVAPGPMRLSEPAYGLLLVTFGAGSLLGSIVTAPAVRMLGRPGVLVLSTVIFALGIATPAFSADARLVGAGFFLAGVSVMLWNITNVSLRQAILPPRLMGRVHATHRFLANASGLLGAFVAGAIGEAFGLPAAFAVGSGIVLVGVLGRFVVTEDRIRRAEAEAGPS